jgi:hypothetical protein
LRQSFGAIRLLDDDWNAAEVISAEKTGLAKWSLELLAERESSRLLFHHIPASLKNPRPV